MVALDEVEPAEEPLEEPLGKFPAVTTAATPTGVRKVNSCLSGISLGTVCPYSRRPSPRKKLQVSMTSCTSPRDSA